MRGLILAGALLAAVPVQAATYIYRGSSFNCEYAYDLFEGPLDRCPTGETLRSAQGRVVIDETKLPGSIAGLEIEVVFGENPIPDYLTLAQATAPLWFDGTDRYILDVGYGKPVPWEPGLLYLRFDEAAQLVEYYMGAFIEYDTFLSTQGDQLFVSVATDPGTDI